MVWHAESTLIAALPSGLSKVLPHFVADEAGETRLPGTGHAKLFSTLLRQWFDRCSTWNTPCMCSLLRLAILGPDSLAIRPLPTFPTLHC